MWSDDACPAARRAAALLIDTAAFWRNELGCTGGAGAWVCSNALSVFAFCNGPACGQSPLAIKAMVREGFPAEKIHYYRGGMQDWTVLGLTTVENLF